MKGLISSRSQLCLHVVRKIACAEGKFVALIALDLTQFPTRKLVNLELRDFPA